ncbi:MAG TPA: 16S rRNA (uracil(1498)-N(3))-methyltransferase [Xanthomonadaceae bacterium]|jgi:16S rRNA (uracil1498-N3)-methyltransferase|nr:16S rRNA (uracil(1498)-N(3))-methyltransferase [Xanthomonadaceae bacterium]
MRVMRAFVEQPLAPGMELALPEDAAAHLVRVLRLREGDGCVLFNGDGHDHPATIMAVGKREARVRIDGRVAVDNESPLRITLVQGLARGEKMDLILQKATELGVAAFVPVASERSEVRLDPDRVDKRLAHWRSVVRAACEQSGRARVPEIAPPLPLGAALAGLPAGVRFLLDPAATRAIDASALTGGACVLAIGPEGGWSPRDRGQLRDTGFIGLRLGPRILRTETAGLAAIAVLQALHGDFA